MRGVEHDKDVREPKFVSRIGMVGIKSVFRRATLRYTNGDESVESSIKQSYDIFFDFFFFGDDFRDFFEVKINFEIYKTKIFKQKMMRHTF